MKYPIFADFLSLLVPSAVPATFRVGLKNQDAPEKGNVTLRCELSKSGVPVEWWRGETELSQVLSGGKFQMKLEGRIAEMTITNVQPEDIGKYSCVTGDQKTTAVVKVQGKQHLVYINDFPFR